MTTDPSPLSDPAIVELVDSVVGSAVERRLWCFFLAADHQVLPSSLCIGDLPATPVRTEVLEVGGSLRAAAGAIGAESLLAVWERPGGSALEPEDRRWLRSLSDACTAGALAVRAVVLSHGRGVRAVAPAEYGC